ncbi:MAG: phosphoribosylglycinamide formyltransferase [Candidatus Marinimicrobia bacterium]|nr:phosphoribosylglycinamide formyltransferase [Candidatus Neomarinimicrobiota bacterium]
MNPKNKSVNIVVFASGSGSNFKSINEKINAGEINAEIKLLVSNNPKSGVLEYADDEGIPMFIHNKTRFSEDVEYINSLFTKLKDVNADLLVLAGYMKKIPDEIVAYFERRIINIHPSLLPKFGGKGFFGMNVHRAVIEKNEKESGASVHFVNKIYDDGPIVAQSVIEVSVDESPEELAKRVLVEEHILYPKVVKAFCENRILWQNNKPKIVEEC